MTDYFALLHQARRPWLDPEVLKKEFLELSAGVHPDRVHHLGEAERAAAQERYVQLNAAYHCLREPKDRLRHLLELESGAVPADVQNMPSELMDLAVAVGEVSREADRLIARKAGNTSPLLKVQFFAGSQDWIEKLRGLQQQIAGRRDLLLDELRRIDQAWVSGDGTGSAAGGRSLRRLEDLRRLLSCFERWLGQIQERIVRLAF